MDWENKYSISSYSHYGLKFEVFQRTTYFFLPETKGLYMRDFCELKFIFFCRHRGDNWVFKLGYRQLLLVKSISVLCFVSVT